MSNNKCVYYKEKEQKSFDGGITWVDTGRFRKGALISTQASQCGSYTNEYRWIKADYVCDNGNKYNGYKQQVSHDNGGSWVDTGVVNIGELISSNSKDCGYNEQWFVLTGDNNFICDGAAKYKKKEMKYTRDSGTTWNSFDPPKYEKGDLIEETSTDCASMKVTYVDGSTKIFYGLTRIGQNTDKNKANAKEVVIYDGVTSIGNGAFSGCTNLKYLTISDTVTSIGDRAIYNCSNMASITIPNSVRYIGFDEFLSCGNLIYITVKATTPPKLANLTYAFNGIATIYVPDASVDVYKTADVWKEYAGKIKAISEKPAMNVTYKDGSEKTFYNLTSIGQNTDSNKANAKEAILYDGVKEIGYMAFSGCTNLTCIIIPDGVTSIGNAAFQNCSSLTSITIPDSVTEIVDAFNGCSNLKTMAIKATTPPALGSGAIPSAISVIYVPDDSVNSYKSADGWNIYADKIKGMSAKPAMKVIYTDNSEKTFYGLTRIGENTDSNKANAKEVEIYDIVTKIGEKAFKDCTNITSVTIPNSVTLIFDFAFWECKKLTGIRIPNSVIYIGGWAFDGCRGLESLKLPYNIRMINTSIVGNCTSLTSITIPNSVTYIGNGAFGGCTSLTSITIPDSVTFIHAIVFYNCTSLKTITVKATTPPALGDKAFDGCFSFKAIYVPAASVNSYKSADEWSNYASKIQAIP